MATREPESAAALATGAAEVDREHHLQLDLLDRFSSALAAGAEHGVLAAILDQLVDFTKMHFASEEALMRLYGYERFAAHVAQHEETLERIEALRQASETGAEDLTAETLVHLRHWLVEHIRYADRAFGRFLVSVRDTPGDHLRPPRLDA